MNIVGDTAMNIVENALIPMLAKHPPVVNKHRGPPKLSQALPGSPAGRPLPADRSQALPGSAARRRPNGWEGGEVERSAVQSIGIGYALATRGSRSAVHCTECSAVECRGVQRSAVQLLQPDSSVNGERQLALCHWQTARFRLTASLFGSSLVSSSSRARRLSPPGECD